MSRSDPVGDLLNLLGGVKVMGNGWTARCPAHDDGHNSLKVDRGTAGQALIYCHAGCEQEQIVGAIGWTMKDLYPSDCGLGTSRGGGDAYPPSNAATLQHAGLTVAQYAAAKQLDPNRLRAFGVQDASYFKPPAIRISYRDDAGNEPAVRFRLSLDKSADGDDRFKWRKGSKLCLYGLDRLSLARKLGYAVLVEGESDCHTLWSHDEPAVGIPGANNWNDSRDAQAFDGIATIYLVVEPDQGGETLLKKLSNSTIRDRVHLVELSPHKDASALHCGDQAQFAERWQAALGTATPLAKRLDTEAQEAAEAAWAACQAIARDADILCRAGETVAALGVAGERTATELVFLAMISRFLARPVSVAVKGPSSAGKSYLVEQTLRLFPAEAYYALTAMSERALAYSDEPLAHRMMVLYEAAGMSGDMASYLMRSLLSEGCVRYETVEKTKEGLRGRLIERPGPTGLIVTTTAAHLHPENETRMVSLTIADNKEQTQAIFRALANGHGPEPDLTSWHALQHWLASGERRVAVPFADALAQLVPPKAVRLRRDFGLVLTLIRAHALLHRGSRAFNSDGAILATLDDYEAVRRRVEPLIAAGVEATIPETIRETIEAVQTLCPTKEDTTTLTAVARKLGLDKSAASRRVSVARERGYLVNHEMRRGQPAKYAVGEPLPVDSPILPDRCSVAALIEGIDAALSPPRDSDRVGADSGAYLNGKPALQERLLDRRIEAPWGGNVHLSNHLALPRSGSATIRVPVA